MSRDPSLFESDDLSLYRYVVSNPANLADPEGLQAGAVGIVPPGYKPPTCAELKEKFDKWLEDEMKHGTDWTKDLPSCPCALACPTGTSGDPQNPDSDLWEDPSSWLHGFHKGAKWCMRSKSTGTPDKPKPSQQCCYDKYGKLFTHSEGAGTPDVISSGDRNFKPGRHQDVDVTPARWALRLDECYPDANPRYILRYNTVRPPNPGKDKDGKPCPKNP